MRCSFPLNSELLLTETQRSSQRGTRTATRSPLPDAGVLPAKRHLITVVDTFELPPPKARGPKPKNAKTPPVRKLTTRKSPRKPKVSKPRRKAVPKASEPERRPEPTPAEVEANRQRLLEHARLQAQEQRRQAKAAGLCRDCHQPAIPDQTRCEAWQSDTGVPAGGGREAPRKRPPSRISRHPARLRFSDNNLDPGRGPIVPAGTGANRDV